MENAAIEDEIFQLAATCTELEGLKRIKENSKY